MPNRMSQSLRSSLTSTPAIRYSLSEKHLPSEPCATRLISLEFFNIHLHCAGVSATLLSPGTRPSRISPILVIFPLFIYSQAAKLLLNAIQNKHDLRSEEHTSELQS